MAQIEIFKNESFGEVRVAGTSEEPLFCASDLCRALGYVNGRDAVSKHVDEGDVAKCDTPTLSGIQQMTYVNESGLYALIFGSKQQNAKAFKRWVTTEVLPSIRKTGSYPVKKEENIFFSIASIIKLRIFAALSHIQRRTEACFLDRHFLCLKSNVANIAAVHPVLLLNGVATAFEVCDNGGSWTAVFSCPIMP